jgi:hypothetical protein
MPDAPIQSAVPKTVQQENQGRISIFEGVIWGRDWHKGSMSSCCLNSVPQFDSRFETFAAPVADWAARLTAGLARRSMSLQATRTVLELCRRRSLDVPGILLAHRTLAFCFPHSTHGDPSKIEMRPLIRLNL